MSIKSEKLKRKNCVGFGATFIVPEVIAEGACVYRVIFDTGLFYIGSTTSLKNRISFFLLNFKSGLHLSKKFKYAVAASNTCSIEVLRPVHDETMLKEMESQCIGSFKDNPLLINRSLNANSNSGVKWSESERDAISKKTHITKQILKKRRLAQKKVSKPVVMFDYNNKQIGSFMSISHVCRKHNLDKSSVRKVLKGEYKTAKGYTFKYAS